MVEGIPLGLELAAAWVGKFSCHYIAGEIERNLDFLASATRDAPGRHQSLRATFEHSWKLLSEDERNTLCGLAIFQGGFQRDAAEQVVGTSLPLLATLVSKSLVRRTESGRYDLHEVIRQYAQSHLADDSARETAIRNRHSEYYLRQLCLREQALKSAALRETLRELTDEIDNLRAAWVANPAPRLAKRLRPRRPIRYCWEPPSSGMPNRRTSRIPFPIVRGPCHLPNKPASR